MDATELILLGKSEKVYAVGNFEFHLTTMDANSLTQTAENPNNLQILIQSVTKIVNTKTKEAKEYNTPESKKELAGLLNAMQGNVIARLIAACNDLHTEQESLLRDMSGQVSTDDPKKV